MQKSKYSIKPPKQKLLHNWDAVDLALADEP